MTHSVVVGLGFGDEGKGRIVDYLCASNDIKAVVRFSGGAQAAHNVVTSDGRHHTFAQFGSGTLRGVPTYLSRYMMVNPLNLMREYESLDQKVDFDPLDRLFIDAEATVTTVYHRHANRWREEARGNGRHGSCGQGIGETAMLRLEGLEIKMRDLTREGVLYDKLNEIQRRYIREFGVEFKDETAKVWDAMADLKAVGEQLQIVHDVKLDDLLASGDCVFEGSQGVLLDEWFGFHPYTTWSTTTPENALRLLGGYDSTVIGVTRTYMTRHGAGPFPTELDGPLEDALPEDHNGTGVYQGAWRRGLLDLPLLNYASRVCTQLDTVAVTHMDRPIMPVVTEYERIEQLQTKTEAGRPKSDLGHQEDLTRALSDEFLGYKMAAPSDSKELLGMIENATGVEPSIIASGPTSEDTRVLQLR